MSATGQRLIKSAYEALAMAKGTTVSVVAKKKGDTAETGRQGKSNMLNVAEKAPKASLLSKVGNDFIMASPDKKAADWLETNIEKSKGKITTVVADLTPALARVLLNRNEGNRRISEANVVAYARDMANGAWQFNGEPIIISADGLLNDGQNRCEAVIHAEVAISALFVFGVGRETRTTVDQGKARTVGDFLAMGGHVNVNELGAAGNCAWQYLAFGRLAKGGSMKATKSEIIAFVDAHQDIIKSVQFAHRKGADSAGGRVVLAFVHWAIWQKSGRAKADAFIDNMIEGAGLGAKSPILYVRNRLIAMRGKLKAQDRAELLFKAWNADRRGETPRMFEITGMLPKLER